MVEWVKLNVPNSFPLQFSEGLVRSWVKARKRKREAEEDETGPEEGCKPPPGAAMLDRGSDPRGQGNRILPWSFYSDAATLIMGQYHCGVPTTSTLLLPMVRGLAEARELVEVNCFKEGDIPLKWVQRLTHSMGLSIRRSQIDKFRVAVSSHRGYNPQQPDF